MPDRRHALRLVGSTLVAGVAGCIGRFGRTPTDTRPTDTTRPPVSPDSTDATTTSDSETPRHHQTEATDTEADTSAPDVDLTPGDLTLSGRVRQALVADPPRISLRLTNDAGVPLHYFADTPLPMNVIYNEGSDDYTAYLLPDDPKAELDPASEYDGWDSVVPDSPRDGCWQGPPAIVIGGVSGTGVLDAGASVAESYTFLDAAGDGACFAPDEYTFQQHVIVNVRGRETTLDCRLRVVLRVTSGRTVELARTAVLEREQTAGD